LMHMCILRAKSHALGRVSRLTTFIDFALGKVTLDKQSGKRINEHVSAR